MISVQLERDREGIWLSIDNQSWEMSPGAFSQLCLGLHSFDASTETMRRIALEVSEETRPDYSHTGEAIGKRLRG